MKAAINMILLRSLNAEAISGADDVRLTISKTVVTGNLMVLPDWFLGRSAPRLRHLEASKPFDLVINRLGHLPSDASFQILNAEG